MRRIAVSVRSVAAVSLAMAFAGLYDGIALMPVVAPGLPVRLAARIQDASHGLRFGLSLAAFGVLWWGFLNVYGAAARKRSPRERRRDAWILWSGAIAVTAAFVAPLFLL